MALDSPSHSLHSINRDNDSLAKAAGTPLPISDSQSDFNRRASAVPSEPLGSNAAFFEKPEAEGNTLEGGPTRSSNGGKKRMLLLGVVAAVIVVGLGVGLGVGLTVGKNNGNKSSNGGSGGSSGNGGSGNGGSGNGNGGNGGNSNLATTGGNGSTITTENGTTFTYVNNYGGYWIDDSNDPFNDGAQCNSWTPPLNQTWDWSKNKINGVNLGGWFVLEPFIVPSLYEKYPTAVDEWTMSQAMAADTASGGLEKQMTDHYDTFITEQDIAEIAGAGLNYVRVPIPFWAVDEWDGEPFLAKACWPYVLRLFKWARKYGIRVNLDLHTIPGSQNGYNHSGKSGQINFMMGVMGYANAQRALEYMRVITEFISQPEYRNVVTMFSFLNEALITTIGVNQMSEFYYQVYNTLRGITGVGEGNGPYLAMHDGFRGTDAWAGFFPGADRYMLDVHPYICFNGQPNNDPVASWAAAACTTFGPGMLSSQTGFGITIAGEFSAGYNDCGYMLNGPSNEHSTSANCTFWQDATLWDQATLDGVKSFVQSSMEATQNWFFWTWKIGDSTTLGKMACPLWSYSHGLKGGWIPTDPRTTASMCDQNYEFSGAYASSQTGADPSATLQAAVSASFGHWPPTDISGIAADITIAPTYTATASVPTLPPPTLTPAPTKSVDVGDGWFNTADTASGVTTVNGCTYPNAWDSNAQTMPTAACTGA
ncbi:glycoside hydrolase [Schizopora paradoxa]|uniref:glucan 1,3-beta-glucosidase n=1 Tax=Schizopora paradoxa TaxID=27342 RepID=A0A0H2RPC3_9AGAM|nr:glycoside hydrolase [Schizopora paradoxa]